MVDNIVSQNSEIISVGELNKSAKYLLENNFNNISVIGEISNLSRPSSGHIYFTLKDEDGAIRCAMFKNQNLKLNFSPENGDKCVLKGQVSIYAPRGDYQLIVTNIEPAGSGNLMQKFEELKRKLEQEGLFAKSNKLQVPFSPKHVCIVTSSSTAAFQDIISTINRRSPGSEVSISEATVQGDNAHISIIKSLERIIKYNDSNKDNLIDVVILSRGGGSIEDLWCFNNEDLAREISNFPIPTISGVGHEIDFTICDFVCDIRMPTPTASAELVTEFNFKIKDALKNFNEKINKNIFYKIEELKKSVELGESKLKNPLTLLREKSQKLDSFEFRIMQSQKLIFSNKNNLLNKILSNIEIKNPLHKVENYKSKIHKVSMQLKTLINEKHIYQKNNLDKLSKSINLLSPLSILDRGYAIIMDKKGSAIKSSKQVNIGEDLKARLSKGDIDIKVTNKNG